MYDPRVDKVIKLLEAAKKSSAELLELLKPEQVTFEVIRGQIESANAKKKQAYKELEDVQKEIVLLKQAAKDIKKETDEKVSKRMEEARKVVVEAVQLHNQTKLINKEADKKQWKDHMGNLEDHQEKIESALK